METKRKNLVDKIVKLFRLGEHVATDGQKGTTEAEMLLAVTKARQMMIDHAVSMAEIEAAKGGDISQRIDDRIRSYGTYVRVGKLAEYDWQVAHAVGVLTDTRVFRQTGMALSKKGFSGTTGVLFVGDEDDVAVANELFMIWLKDVRRLTRVAYGGGNTWGIKHTSYAVGLAFRLKERAGEIVSRGTVALVLRAKSDAIDRWTEKNAGPPPEEKKKRNPKIDNDAFSRGYRDGGAFDLSLKNFKQGE